MLGNETDTVEGVKKSMEPKQGKEREITPELLQQFQKEIASVDASLVTEKVSGAAAHVAMPAKDTITAILTEALNKGVMPKNALHLGDETMEAIYGQGYNLYNQGRYKEASYIFRLLMLLDYMTPKYILGLAASLHRMKDYKAAANVYLLCGTLDGGNPLPHYHAADCYIQLNLPIMAIFSLDLAITAAGTQPQYAVIRERALLMRDTLDKQVRGEKKGEEKPSTK
jgi:type III secretion system low calcium response chaperone LcrH/SycD